MKKLEFETSKGKWVLIDGSDLPKVDKIIVENDTNFIKLSDITEEQASEIVQMTWISDNINLCEFKNYDTNGNGSLSSSIESLHSLIESKGVHLFENPYENSTDLNSSFFSMQEDFNKEKEAEEKTFYNPYLFKVI